MSVEINITDQIVEIEVAAGASITPVWGGITGTLSNQTDLQNALNAKVPYSGATANVDLGEYELKAGQIELDQSPTGVAGVAVTRWNDTIGSTETTLKGGSVILKNGVDLVARVVNKVSPNTTLTKAAYQAVRISGAQGQRLAIELAQANNDNNSADTIGLVTETIAANQEGFIMTVGSLEGINTTGSLQGETWVDGDVLYLSPTIAGRITNVKPIAPQHLVVIGYVEYAHANNGKIYVKVMNGWELGELHDVDTTGAVAGNVLKYNGTIWQPSGDVGITSLNGLNAVSQSFATGTSGTDFNISSATSTHTFNLPSASGTNRGLLTSADWTTFNNKQNALTNPVTGTGVSGQVAYWSGTNTQTGSNNLFWDNANGRLGIGTNAPTSRLHVTSTAWNSTEPFVSFVNLDPQGAESRGLYVQAGAISSSSYIANFANFSGTSVFYLDGLGNLGIKTTSPTYALDVADTARFRNQIRFATDLWNVSHADSANRLFFSASGSTFFGSASGYAWQNSSSSNIMSLFSTGNLVLQNGGTHTDSGQRLQVNGTARIAGVTTLAAGAIFQGQSITQGFAIEFQSAASARFYNSTNSVSTDVYHNGTYLVFGGATRTSSTAIFDGSVGIGTTSLTGTNIRIGKNLTGFTTSMSLFNESQIQSDVNTAAYYFATSANTQAATFSLSQLFHYFAGQGSVGAGSTVNNQYGFYVVNLATGPITYGFYGDIASGTDRWNLYMNGTASNFISGNTQIGTGAFTSEKLQVNGTMKVTGASTFGGNVTIPIGSYDAPSLSFASDSNTGMFSPLADNLEIKTGTHNAVTLENQGVNLMQYSEALGAFPTNFQQISVSIPGSVVAPDGTTNANIAIPDTSSNQHRFFRVMTLSQPHTVSVYAKSAGYNFISLAAGGGAQGETIIFDIVNGTISGTAAQHTALIENVGNGWFRCSLTIISTSGPTSLSRWIIVRNANSTAAYSGDGTSGVYLWGWQIEESSASTSYIKTGATAATRPQAVTVLGQNLYGNLITRKVGAPSLTDFALTTDYVDRLIVKATTGNVIVNSSLTAASLNLSALNTAPATASSTGTLGEIRITADYIYICTATNTWKRVAIATW